MQHAPVRLRLRLIREARGLTQVALAQQAGCTPAYICKLESHHGLPSLIALIALSTALEVRPWDLVQQAPCACCGKDQAPGPDPGLLRQARPGVPSGEAELC